MFGFPCPKIPCALTDKVRGAVGVCDGGSSISKEFDALNSSVAVASRRAQAADSGAEKNVRGDLLREFKQLLAKYDTTNDFCGLELHHTDKGRALWTLKSNKQK